MPLKYYCPKCDKRYIDWGAEKLEYKCPNCNGEPLYRVGTQPDGDNGAPALSKLVVKRKAQPKVKSGRNGGGEFRSNDGESGGEFADDNDVMEDVDLDGDDDDGNSIGDSLGLEDD